MNVEERVKHILIEQLGLDEEEYMLTAQLWDDFGVDSLDALELVVALEEAYGIEIPNEAAVNIDTPLEIVNYLKDRGVK